MIIGLSVGAFRLRYFVDNTIPLGYDPGIYRAIADAYHQISRLHLDQLPARIRHEPGRGMFTSLLTSTGVSIDRRLTRGIGLISLLPAVVIFLVLKKKNLIRATLASFLVAVSLIQYELFRWHYFKQLIGISLMLITLRSFSERKFRPLLVTSFLLFINHRNTALFTLIILVIQCIREFRHNKAWVLKMIKSLVIAWSAALIVYLPLFDRLILPFFKPLVTTFGGEGQTGDFIEKTQMAQYAIITLLGSCLGLRYMLRNRIEKSRLIGFGIGLLRTTLGLLNYKRVFGFFDIFAIILTAYGLRQLILHHKKLWRIITWVALTAQSSFYLFHVWSQSYPLITSSQFESVKQIPSITASGATIMITDSAYTPRFLGYTSRAVIAPGMSDLNHRNYEQRITRRQSSPDQKCKLIEIYQKHQPLYLRKAAETDDTIQENICFHYLTGQQDEREMREVRF